MFLELYRTDSYELDFSSKNAKNVKKRQKRARIKVFGPFFWRFFEILPGVQGHVFRGGQKRGSYLVSQDPPERAKSPALSIFRVFSCFFDFSKKSLSYAPVNFFVFFCQKSGKIVKKLYTENGKIVFFFSGRVIPYSIFCHEQAPQV